MRYEMFCIYDTAAQIWELPWFCLTEDQAKREFVNRAANPDDNVAKHPSDYVLMHVGIFDNTDVSDSKIEMARKVMTGFEARIICRRNFAELNRLADDVEPGIAKEGN